MSQWIQHRGFGGVKGYKDDIPTVGDVHSCSSCAWQSFTYGDSLWFAICEHPAIKRIFDHGYPRTCDYHSLYGEKRDLR